LRGSDDFLKDPEPGSLDISIAVDQGKPDNKNSQVAASINSNENTVFLDTETTGVSLNDQIIEIAIVDNKGNRNVSIKMRHLGQIIRLPHLQSKIGLFIHTA
jgi:uncharacterized protein YprB with RNaseH-like and TPR domain